MSASRFLRPALLAFALVFATEATAQGHTHHHADSSAAHEHGAMMQLHHRMAADSLIHERMMADPELRAAMAEMMGSAMDMEAMHERMAAMTPEERAAMRARMHEQMHERMMALPADERQARMGRMMEAHRRLMEDPAVRERMMADPEMRRMMQGVMHDEGKHKMGHGEHGKHGGEEAAARVADRFHEALTAADRAAVEALLHEDAVVLEGGKAETRDEYFGHHFGADAAFLAGLGREPLSRRVTVAGDAAWVASTQRLSGTYNDRPIDLDSAELLVLRRDGQAPDGWRIAAVHWSSASQN